MPVDGLGEASRASSDLCSAAGECPESAEISDSAPSGDDGETGGSPMSDGRDAGESDTMDADSWLDNGRDASVPADAIESEPQDATVVDIDVGPSPADSPEESDADICPWADLTMDVPKAVPSCASPPDWWKEMYGNCLFGSLPYCADLETKQGTTTGWEPVVLEAWAAAMKLEAEVTCDELLSQVHVNSVKVKEKSEDKTQISVGYVLVLDWVVFLGSDYAFLGVGIDELTPALIVEAMSAAVVDEAIVPMSLQILSQATVEDLLSTCHPSVVMDPCANIMGGGGYSATGIGVVDADLNQCAFAGVDVVTGEVHCYEDSCDVR